MPELLFVCYGNICRSPMAEVFMDHFLDERLGSGRDFVVSSAGVGAMDGTPATMGAGISMAAHGLDMSRHRARHLTPAIARRADRIWCMEPEQVDYVREMIDDPSKVELLGSGIADPIGADQEFYDIVAGEIERHVRALAERLAKERVG